MISVAAWQAGEAGDAVAYAAIREEGERFIRRLMQSDPATVLDELVNKVAASGLAASFAQTSGKLGLAEESERWKTLEETWVATKKANGDRGFFVDGRPADEDRVSGLFLGCGLAGLQRQLSHPPPVSDRDLRPGRMIDHELVSWFCAWAAWLVMLLMLAGFSLYRFRVAGLVRDLAKRFECLLQPVDWLWILGAGVLLPFFYAMLVCALATLVFKRAEQYWYEQDSPMKLDASMPGWSRYEYQCAVQMRKELRELLGEGY